MGDPTTPTPATVKMVDPDGKPHDVPLDQVDNARIQLNFKVEGQQERDARLQREVREDLYGGVKGKIGAVAAAIPRGVTGGLSDVYYRATQGEAGRKQLETYKQLEPELSVAGEVAGSLVSPIGRVGSAISKVGEGASIATRIGKSALGGSVEGGLYGAGSGVSELALSDKPLDLERAISTISSHALFGGAIGGAAGTLGKVAEIGLSKAKGAVDDFVAKRSASNVTDDLAAMDVKQLRAARELEIDSLKNAHKVETEALESARVAERQSIADEIGKLRREVKDNKHFLTTDGVKLTEVEGLASAAELGKKAVKAERQLAHLIDNPKGLAQNPGKALDALQRQEGAMTGLLERGDELRAVFAADKTGERLAALESIPGALEKNRALQARIAEVAKPHTPLPTTSPRLEAIEAAKEALAQGAGPVGGIVQQLQGPAVGAAIGAVVGGGPLGAVVGAGLTKLLGEKVFGRLGKAANEQALKTAQVAQKLFEPAAKGVRVAVPLASRTLTSVKFAAEKPTTGTPKKQGLASLFDARASEVREQTVIGPDGKAQMTPEARAKVTERLAGVGALSPIIADKLETIAARRIEFLADKLPKRPDLPGMDNWKPSDTEMRKWARYVAGVEDPSGIEERLAAGQISVEDAEVMRKVYPERLSELTRQIIGNMPAAKSLPYHKQLAVSMMTGINIVPAMDPRIMKVLQGQYATEDVDAGGPPGPTAKPAFGSVEKQPGTPAQERAG